ncbi:MAG: tRNA (adenosine(37)-N6)-threonylcarbamoyltransferase complex transferase subunit TsaD [Actinobacteria bacterium]|nr:tRNA (adenosine(37)-N6)-threonylcarbamoyltransferase complex transferase subunit TsaD [Actinomycetota bacterium]MCL5446560.1 tRNA (adenosine(37)-N6)-threonylcarbamoyltransferase complex transferase subunit TsaD [Actinomycetota bacterium]
MTGGQASGSFSGAFHQHGDPQGQAISCPVLGIETSCDETAAALVTPDGKIISSVVSSQVDLHSVYGGVVPEIAGRAHLDMLLPVLENALTGRWRRSNGESPGGGRPARRLGLSAVAATVGPGLAGALLVGASAGKALALGWGIPFVGVNHLEGHLFAALLDHPDVRFPLAVLLVSGGHTMLLSMDAPGNYRLLGRTVDDAAGEAFDKVARYIGLGYPGGPAIEAAARNGDPKALSLPRPMIDNGLDLSFSGLKTAAVRAVRAQPSVSSDDVAASFQQAAVEVLTTKVMRAAEATGAAGVCLAGGVAANAALRDAVRDSCAVGGIPCYLPSRAMCTDNAAMVAAAGIWQLEHFGPSRLDTSVDPSLELVKLSMSV